jgi:death-on-curing protein
MGCRYLDLVDFLLIAEAVTGVPAERLAHNDRLGLADSALNAPAAAFEGNEAYPDFSRKAAVLCRHLIKNHPLPDGNKRCAFLCLLEFVARNDRQWTHAPDDPAETDEIIRGVAGDTVDEDELEAWIKERIGEVTDG